MDSDNAEFKFDLKYQKKLIRLLISEPEQMEHWKDKIQPHYFETKWLQWFYKQSVDYYVKNNNSITFDYLNEQIKGLDQEKHNLIEYLDVFKQLQDLDYQSDKNDTLDLVTEYVKRNIFVKSMKESAEAYNHGKFDTAYNLYQKMGEVIEAVTISKRIKPMPLEQLIKKYPEPKPVIIDGILRQRETLNIIAPAKTGKSMLVQDLAISVAMGLPWLGHSCTQGKVLLIDNELDPEDISHRIKKVCEAKGLDYKKISENLDVYACKGHLVDLPTLEREIYKLKTEYTIIIIDSFYRVFPEGQNENANSEVSALYSILDKIQVSLNCSIVLTDHVSKGDLSKRNSIDLGVGAGAKARACGSQLTLKPHPEEYRAFIMEVNERSFAGFEPICVRYEYPLWILAPELNVPERNKKSKPFTYAQFLVACMTNIDQSKSVIITKGENVGLSERQVKRFLDEGIGKGEIIVTGSGPEPRKYKYQCQINNIINSKVA
jgi:hypothetical protein